MKKHFLYVILIILLPLYSMEDPKKTSYSSMTNLRKYELITEESTTITYAGTFDNSLDLRASQCTMKDSGTQEYSAIIFFANGTRMHSSPLHAHQHFNRMQYIHRLGQHKEYKTLSIEKISSKK